MQADSDLAAYLERMTFVANLLTEKITSWEGVRFLRQVKTVRKTNVTTDYLVKEFALKKIEAVCKTNEITSYT